VLDNPFGRDGLVTVPQAGMISDHLPVIWYF
jgi:hypothetical protein